MSGKSWPGKRQASRVIACLNFKFITGPTRLTASGIASKRDLFLPKLKVRARRQIGCWNSCLGSRMVSFFFHTLFIGFYRF
jgi:hypothetical protein